jgi:hypothetical protein
MNRSESTENRRATDPVTQQREHPGADTAHQEPWPVAPTLAGNGEAHHVEDERTFETFAGGDGI